MTDKIYKVFLVKFTEAWYRLSPEEQETYMAKLGEAMEQAGGKGMIYCDARWSSEQWSFFGIEEFPDVEAVQKHTRLLEEMDHYRYIDSISVLGTEYTAA